jgi:signal transduction histidine kinase
MAHLIDNAVKYTGSGGRIDVAIRTEQGRAIVSVADTGIGIPASLQSEVFGRFYRVDTSRTEPGNGLGLSLAQAIVRAHGGQLSLESEAGRGSSFTVHIPLREVSC